MGYAVEVVYSLHKHSHQIFSPERAKHSNPHTSKAAAMEGCVHRKAGKVTGLIFFVKELLEFLSGLESVQFISPV